MQMCDTKPPHPCQLGDETTITAVLFQMVNKMQVLEVPNELAMATIIKGIVIPSMTTMPWSVLLLGLP